MATTSQLPEFIDALYTTAFGVLSATTTVVDGPPLSWDPLVTIQGASLGQFLFIGAHPDDDSSAIGQQDRNTMGSSRDERIDVYCTVYAVSGDQVAKANRDAAFALVGMLEQAIRVDQTLGGQVATSRISNVDRVDQTQNDTGSDCTVIFTVTGKAFLR
jgi:hypothetical protein